MIAIGINFNLEETLDIIEKYYYHEEFDKKMNEYLGNKLDPGSDKLDPGSNKQKLTDCVEDVKFVNKLLHSFSCGSYKLSLHLKEKYKEYKKNLEDRLPFDKYINQKIFNEVLDNQSEIKIEIYPRVSYYGNRFPEDCLFIGISTKDYEISLDKWNTYINIAKYIFKEYNKEISIRRFIG